MHGSENLLFTICDMLLMTLVNLSDMQLHK